MTPDTWSNVDRYFAGRLIPADAALDAALDASQNAGMPPIHVSPAQGRFLSMLAASIRAAHILEVGTLAGYSAIWLARALPPHGRLVTLEIDPMHARVATQNIGRAGLADRVQVLQGPANDSLAILQSTRRDPFDLVFIDADKKSIPEYFESSIRLTRPGGLIVVDNVVRDGKVTDDPPHDEHVAGVRRFVEAAAADPRVEVTVIQTVGSKGYDGFALARVLP